MATVTITDFLHPNSEIPDANGWITYEIPTTYNGSSVKILAVGAGGSGNAQTTPPDPDQAARDGEASTGTLQVSAVGGGGGGGAGALLYGTWPAEPGSLFRIKIGSNGDGWDPNQGGRVPLTQISGIYANGDWQGWTIDGNTVDNYDKPIDGDDTEIQYQNVGSTSWGNVCIAKGGNGASDDSNLRSCAGKNFGGAGGSGTGSTAPNGWTKISGGSGGRGAGSPAYDILEAATRATATFTYALADGGTSDSVTLRANAYGPVSITLQGDGTSRMSDIASAKNVTATGLGSNQKPAADWSYTLTGGTAQVDEIKFNAAAQNGGGVGGGSAGTVKGTGDIDADANKQYPAAPGGGGGGHGTPPSWWTVFLNANGLVDPGAGDGGDSGNDTNLNGGDLWQDNSELNWNPAIYGHGGGGAGLPNVDGTYHHAAPGQGATGIVAFQYTVEDDPPIIDLEGDTIINLTVGDAFIEPGFRAYDYETDGTGRETDLSSFVTINYGGLDTSSAQNTTTSVKAYTITYTVSYEGLTTTVTRTVNVSPDTTAPSVTVLGANPYYVTKGSTYSDPGITYSDNVTPVGELTVTNNSGNITTSSAGTQTVTYTVTDKANNKTTKTRTVVVTDNPPLNKSIADAGFQGGSATSSGAVSLKATYNAMTPWMKWSNSGTSGKPSSATIVNGSSVYENLTTDGLRGLLRYGSVNWRNAASAGANYKFSSLRNHGGATVGVRVKSESSNVYYNAGNGAIDVRVLGPAGGDCKVQIKLTTASTYTESTLAHAYSIASFTSVNGYGIGNDSGSPTVGATGNTTYSNKDDTQKRYNVQISSMKYGSSTINNWPYIDTTANSLGIKERLRVRIGITGTSVTTYAAGTNLNWSNANESGNLQGLPGNGYTTARSDVWSKWYLYRSGSVRTSGYSTSVGGLISDLDGV